MGGGFGKGDKGDKRGVKKGEREKGKKRRRGQRTVNIQQHKRNQKSSRRREVLEEIPPSPLPSARGRGEKRRTK